MPAELSGNLQVRIMCADIAVPDRHLRNVPCDYGNFAERPGDEQPQEIARSDHARSAWQNPFRRPASLRLRAAAELLAGALKP